MRKLLLLFLCTIVPAVVSAQRLDVTGRVLVKDTGKPIGQAVVELPQSGLWAVADADGNFTVKGVPAGETRFVVSCLGFVTTEAEVDVRTGMGPVRLYAPEDNLKLESVVVTAKEAPNAMATSRTIGGACLAAYIVEIAKMRSCTFPLMYIRRDLNTCNNCGLCEKKCPYQLPIHDYVKVKHVDCTLCGNCIGACAKDALQVNGRRSLRWVPGLLAVVLFFLAIWLGSTMELPTIDEKWGDYEKVENLQTFEMEGLQTIKCFGSSKAFSAKMQAVQGVYGVKTFVRRHGVEVLYDPAATDTLKIQAAIFAPTLRKYAMPGEQVPVLDVVKLGVEGLHDRMDMIYFGMVLQKIEGVYGFTSEFACPVDVTVYVDPAAGITEKMFGEAIDAKELIIPAKEGEKVIPMHTVLKTYAVAGQVSREEFAQVMFRDVEKLAGRFVANLEKWGDDEQFPKAVYEMVFPGIEKMPIRNAFPYFKSFLSCTDGIVSVDFVLRDMKPVMRIHYVKSMWDDAKLWKEVFQTEKWTLRMADGTFKEADPRLKFTTEGKTVEE